MTLSEVLKDSSEAIEAITATRDALRNELLVAYGRGETNG